MKNKPLIIGHRGAMGHETENSMASIQKALDLGVDMIEIDVFNIASGETVVFHDERVERLTNGGGRIEEYNMYDMRQLILEGNHRIPILQDVLKLINNEVRLNIELKGKNTSDRVNFITNYYIENRGWEANNFLISSFHWDELRSMRAINPDMAIAVLTDGDPLKAIDIAKELNAEAINPSYTNLTAENVKAIHNAGFKVYTYTVNEPEDIARMTDYGVDGIFTNYPERKH
ncbi:MAG: glycerophosphodiester phosphodiesterase [Bacteroidia bacterium]|nr:glycerophosphodiester phosphodiesterase [Bacteroidia bacterium]